MIWKAEDASFGLSVIQEEKMERFIHDLAEELGFDQEKVREKVQRMHITDDDLHLLRALRKKASEDLPALWDSLFKYIDETPEAQRLFDNRDVKDHLKEHLNPDYAARKFEVHNLG